VKRSTYEKSGSPAAIPRIPNPALGIHLHSGNSSIRISVLVAADFQIGLKRISIWNYGA